MIELLLFGMARAADSFNTASCLQLGSVENIALTDYEKAIMNMVDDIKETKKTIRKNTACTTKTKFITLMPSAKKVRISAPP